MLLISARTSPCMARKRWSLPLRLTLTCPSSTATVIPSRRSHSSFPNGPLTETLLPPTPISTPEGIGMISLPRRDIDFPASLVSAPPTRYGRALHRQARLDGTPDLS